ncbi:hypothetical protein MNV49_007331 [Pseudohyphozyma bogoriensis]|nr:hypothetical protein MNV49_007331 [Pseudohyphozyma bogoriensis]
MSTYYYDPANQSHQDPFANAGHPYASSSPPQQPTYAPVPLSHDPEMVDLSSGRPVSGGQWLPGQLDSPIAGPSARDSAGGSAFDDPELGQGGGSDWDDDGGAASPWYKTKAALIAAGGGTSAEFSTDTEGITYQFTTRPIVNPGGYTIGTLTGYVGVSTAV